MVCVKKTFNSLEILFKCLMVVCQTKLMEVNHLQHSKKNQLKQMTNLILLSKVMGNQLLKEDNRF
jgi:hypothetical protein